LRIAQLLDRGVPVRRIRDVRGTVYLCKAEESDSVHFDVAATYNYDELKSDKRLYAEAFGTQYKNQDAISGKAICEIYDNKLLVQNPPMPPLEREELDRVYALPYARTYHPVYEKDGGVPAIEEVRFSITHNRGCFGACNFCALAFHQGRTVRSRSIESVVREAKIITEMPDFKGYIHDVGGPTANFRKPACKKQRENGVCTNRKCLAPTLCPNLEVDHSEYIELLRQIETLPKVKKVFIRSGIRFDYLMADKDDTFFNKLVRDHVSGQLKVAPEHCSSPVLRCMGKPDFEVYSAFRRKFFEITERCGKEQYLVPYLMSSHPGSTMSDAVALAVTLKRDKYAPEQVQDYYPTPGTASTVMFYTGINPLDMKKVYVPTDYREKQLQRALLQFNRPDNAPMVREALRAAHREDLIGYGEGCLVRPEGKGSRSSVQSKQSRSAGQGKGNKKTSAAKAKASSKPTPKSGKNPALRGGPKRKNGK